MAPLSEFDLERAGASAVHGHQSSRDSGQLTNTKGLLNGPGQNNCFLNSAVQVLWHLDIFRRSFRELSGHACMVEACIFCALKELFSQLQFSQESALPPDALRRALAETFFDQQRFQLGCMDDAAECFENILLRIHFHIAREEAEDMCNARHCIPHQKFAMALVEQSVCDACKATSEPLPFTQMVHYVSASALTDEARQLAASSPAHSDLFGQLLRRAGGMGDIRDCPSNCGAKIQICRSLMNRPEIVSVGIVWNSERPTLDQIMAVFATIGTSLRLGDVFHSVVDQRWALNSQHTLVGVVTYYGKHYSTFFFHTKLRLWIYFDDATVREVGPRWEQVVEKCRRGRYQPLLLLYAALGGTPVNTQDAPKFITPVTGLTSQISPGRIHRPSRTAPKPVGTTASVQNEAPHCAVHPNYPLQNGRYFQNGGVYQQSQNASNGYHPNGFRNENLPYQANTLSGAPSQNNSYRPMQNALPHHASNQSSLYQQLNNHNAQYPSIPNGTTNSYVNSCHYDTYQNGPVASFQKVDGDPGIGQNGYIRGNANQVAHLPPLSPGRRAVTPSPEKPFQSVACSSPIRRAVTPNPDTSKHIISDYQNLSEMQAVIMAQTYQQQAALYRSNSVSGTLRKPVQRSNSSDSERSSVFTESDSSRMTRGTLCQAGESSANSPRRRDSGNWSGDRNSASSSSSTSMENPYLYIVGKMQQRSSGNPRAALSKTDGAGHVDPGYDSYSLSSTDSLPLQQGLKHSLQLAQIPEARLPVGQDCESLCREAEELMERSRILEEQGDLEAALVLVQAACGKSRAAMDAPYNNPGNISQARMKHNSCVVGLRSIQRKMSGDKDGNGEPRHSRENSCSSLRGSSKGNHSRQNSRDSNKGQHSRQNSRELLTHPNGVTTPNPVHASTNTKIIRELLPQPVVGIHDLSDKANNIEIYATLPKKKSSVIARVRNRGSESPTKNVIEDAEYLIYDRPGRKDKTTPTKEKRARSEERNKKPEVKPDPEVKVKSKQHKIRRKLLMGGLIRRKNRSMPDLREDEDIKVINLKTQDDSILKTPPTEKQLSGYLSEGHLEFSGNPNLERSRLMRKSLHNKVLSAAKVPPPPPLRTTSQLTKPKPKLPFVVRDDPVQYANVQGMVTRAEVHPTPPDDDNDDAELPPYPSPVTSSSHSRQASEEFPPPPDEILAAAPPSGGCGLLRELQAKLQQKVCAPKLDVSEDVVDFVSEKPKEVSTMVKDLTSKFEQVRFEEPINPSNFTTSVLKLHSVEGEHRGSGLVRKKSCGKKKNVTFCDQVVLVATADDDEDDSFIPNPILERVLRSATSKDDTPMVLPSTAELSVNQTMLQSRMQIPLCAPERSKPPPQYQPPPQCDTSRPPYMQVPIRAFEVNGRGSVNQPDKSASVRLGVSKPSPYLSIPASLLSQNKSNPYYHPLPNKLPQQGPPRPKLFPPYQQPPPPKLNTNRMDPMRQMGPQSETGAATLVMQGRSGPCHLCRKKMVLLPAMYCPDCDFYMSRFRLKS